MIFELKLKIFWYEKKMLLILISFNCKILFFNIRGFIFFAKSLNIKYKLIYLQLLNSEFLNLDFLIFLFIFVCSCWFSRIIFSLMFCSFWFKFKLFLRFENSFIDLQQLEEISLETFKFLLRSNKLNRVSSFVIIKKIIILI